MRGSVRSLRCNKNLAMEKLRKTHFLSNHEKEKLIEDYDDRETAGARKRVEDAEAAIRQEQQDIEATKNAGLKTRQPEKVFSDMIIVVGDSVSDIITSDDGEDGEDEHDEEAEQRQLSEDDEPSWVMGIITKTLPRGMDRFRQMQIKLDELTQLGWEDSADYICQRDTKCGTS